MGLAVTHVLITIILLDLFRHYIFGKNNFPRYLLVVGGIAGLIADIDLPLAWVYNWITNSQISFHGQFTHSFVFPLIFLISGFVLYRQQKENFAKISWVIAVGLVLHIILDCAYGGYTTFLWPLNISTTFCPKWGISNYASGIDAVLLIVWIVHEEVHDKIKDYI